MGGRFIINPSSVSFEDILADVERYVKARPDYAKWKDFYMGSTGEIILQLIAGMSTYLQYHNVVNRREVYLQYAENISSLTAIAETLGYSTYRGKNPHFYLNIVPSQSVLIRKLYTQVGTYSGYGVYSVEDDYTLVIDPGNQSLGYTHEFVIGNLLEDEITITNGMPGLFRFIRSRVSDDMQLLWSRDAGATFEVVDFSERMLDLANGRFVSLSNAVGSVDVMSLNLAEDPEGTLLTQYKDGDVLKIRFIERANITNPDPTKVSLFSGFGTITFGEGNPPTGVANRFVNREDKTSIRLNAPIFHETQLIVRGRDDYMKILKLLVNSEVGECPSVNGIDYDDLYSAAKVRLSYVVLGPDGLWTNPTLSDWNAQVNNVVLPKFLLYRPFGVVPPFFDRPTQREVTVTINLILSDNTVALADINADVAEIIDGYQYMLGRTMEADADGNITDIEYQLESLEYVRVARAEITSGSTDDLIWNEFYKITTVLNLTAG